MRLLLTGATGFVGQNLLLKLIDEPRYELIWCPVRNPEKLKQQLAFEGYSEVPECVRIIESSAAAWNLGEAASADHVVHCAGATFARSEKEFHEVNEFGTIRLLNELKAPTKTVILSSQSAVGPSVGRIPKIESDECAPITAYGRSKLAMEKRVRAEFMHLNPLILCPPMVLGARDSATLPLFKMVRSRLSFKPGRQDKRFSFIAVNDLCDSILRTLEPDVDWTKLASRRYFVGANDTASDREMLGCAAKLCGVKALTVIVPLRTISALSHVVERFDWLRAAVPSLSADRALEIQPEAWLFSSAAFHRDFNWECRTSLNYALAQALDWYIKVGAIRVSHAPVLEASPQA